MITMSLGQFGSVLRTFQVVLLLGATVMPSWMTIRDRLRHDRRWPTAKRNYRERADLLDKCPGNAAAEVTDSRSSLTVGTTSAPNVGRVRATSSIS